MPLTDLPPWLSGESDRGFLQGAQLGISAARTGTDIAATRQQMRESAELQPFRTAAAEIGNRLQRQQFDLGAATFATKVRAGELAVEGQAAGILSANLGIDLKKLELADVTKFQSAAAAYVAGDTKVSPVFDTAEGQSKWINWKADTEFGRAKANEEVAFKQEATALINTATEFLKAGHDTYDYDQNGKRSALPNRAKIASVARAIAKQKADDQVALAERLGKVSTEFKLEIEKAKTEGKLEVIQQQLDKRADEAVNQSDDVNARIAFQEAMKLARSRGDMVEQERLVNEFKLRKKGGPPAATPSNVSKLVSEATDAYNEAYVAGDTKKLPELKAKAVRSKVLELKAVGKVMNPSRPDTWNFKEGELVVFPANKTSPNLEEREEHVRQFSKSAAVALLKERQRGIEAELERDKARRESGRRNEAARETLVEQAPWMRL